MKLCNVLFLCTGNSARSILAEAVLNATGAPRFRGYSAGSHPTGRVNPIALELLERRGVATADLRSKSWEEFAGPTAPAMDIVITVCDNAANEVCPVWLGHPVTAHWGAADPAAIEGSHAVRYAAFEDTFALFESRIARLCALTVQEIDRALLRARLAEIGR